MNCDETRRIIESSVSAAWPAEVTAHLVTCDACLQHALTDGLAAPPAVAVPPGFSDRVVLQLPMSDVPRRWPRWPVIAAAALSALFLATGLWLLLPVAGGSAEPDLWAAWYWALFLVAAGESVVLIAWAWEPATRMDDCSPPQG